MAQDQDHYPGWGDIKHQQTDIELSVSVADALRLESELPALCQSVTETGARTPSEREHRREARAALDRLVAQLHDRLRSFGDASPSMSEGQHVDSQPQA